jgi:hypothetical protein
MYIKLVERFLVSLLNTVMQCYMSCLEIRLAASINKAKIANQFHKDYVVYCKT